MKVKKSLKEKLGLCARKGCFRRGTAEEKIILRDKEGKVIDTITRRICNECAIKSINDFIKRHAEQEEEDGEYDAG